MIRTNLRVLNKNWFKIRSILWIIYLKEKIISWLSRRQSCWNLQSNYSSLKKKNWSQILLLKMLNQLGDLAYVVSRKKKPFESKVKEASMHKGNKTSRCFSISDLVCLSHKIKLKPNFFKIIWREWFGL